MDKFSLDAIREQVEQRYISVQKHPRAGLFIYNYTPKAAYSDYWTPETRACRGLVLDRGGAVVQRPFEKFFNLGDKNVGPVPAEPFEVYEKLDGSLGILYWVDDEPCIATRGSFTSEQAVAATRVLQETYGHLRLDRSISYLFEIILPWNRIVVDYGDTEDLVLLAMIETASGRELPLEEIGFPVAKRYDGIAELDELLEHEAADREGYVVRFQSGLRVKVKFFEYIRLHRLVTVTTARHIWAHVKDGGSVEAMPKWSAASDEFRAWARRIADELGEAFHEIEAGCRADFRDLGDRKANALYYQTRPYSAVLFSMLDGKPYDEIIWKQLRPPPSRPFKVEV